MRFGRLCSRLPPGSALGVMVLVLAATLAGTALAKPGATITADFADSCRNASIHSTKDISHVVIRYVDGRVVTDETVASPGHSIDGGAGDEIGSVEVKSSTTTQTLPCTASNSPPTAVLERKAGSFDSDNPLGTWTSDDCIWPDCSYPVRNAGPDERAVSFRWTGSTDLNDDIVSWSLDPGDGSTPASGSWVTDPPVVVVHDYAAAADCMCTATLTVTDSAGQESSDSMIVSVVNVDTND